MDAMIRISVLRSLLDAAESLLSNSREFTDQRTTKSIDRTTRTIYECCVRITEDGDWMSKSTDIPSSKTNNKRR